MSAPAERPDLRVVQPGDDTAAEVIAPIRREPGRIRTAWTAADLMAMEFPPHAGRCPVCCPRA